jgi:hypothetical protein
MPTLTDSVFDYLMPVYAIIFVVAFYFNWRFLSRVRKLHPKNWAELGSPSIFNNSISSSLKFAGFLFQKKYEVLEDPQLNFYGTGTRIGIFSIAAFLALLVGLGLIAQYQDGVWGKPMVVTGTPVTTTSIFLFGLIISSFFPYSLFLQRLKNHHREKWEQLGRPSFLNQTISNQWAWNGFFWSCKYLSLKDAWLNIYATIIWLSAFGIGIILFAKYIAE